MNKPVMIIGAGGHAKVIAEVILASQDRVVGFLDDHVAVGTQILGYEVLGKVEMAPQFRNTCTFIIAIGSNAIRAKIAQTYDLPWYTAIHPTAQIARDVSIGQGTVIMPYAVINPSARIGDHCILNTGCIVEHDDQIADFVHLAPHATLCGTVTVGAKTHVGASATIINNLTVAADCILGAGCVVIEDILEKGTYVGVPARKLHV